MSLLTLKNISSGYGKKEVITNISFVIDKAEIVTLIGSNGAGKSTLLKVAYGLNSIWGDGKVIFKSEEIGNTKPETLLQKGIVYIGQKNNTFDSLTVEENLKVAGYIYTSKLFTKKLKIVYNMFPSLQNLRTKKPNTLSGGQRQLVALAMGLLHEPKLILFDEPSAGLDIRNMHEIFGIIRKMKKKRGISFLIVEHRVKEISKITDKWIGFKLGRMIYSDAVISEDVLKKIFL